MADVTTKVARMNGFYQPNTLVKTTVHLLDFGAAPDAMGVDTHDLVKIPAGHAVTGVTVVPLVAFTSDGNATLTIKVKAGTETAASIGSAIAKANLAAGKVTKLIPSAGAQLLKDTNGIYAEEVLQATVGAAAFTAGKALIIIDAIPVGDLLVNG